MSRDRQVRTPWEALRQLTPARVALGRAGTALPTDAQLAFELAHARARDAVHTPLDAPRLLEVGRALGLEVVLARSAAPDRATFLRRPDLGRQLNAEARAVLAGLARPEGVDLAVVVADGLSAEAVQAQASAVLAQALPRWRALGWTLAPLVLAVQARVALGDEVGQLLRARQVAVLIGERPGLSAPHSLGVYITHRPRVGCTDAERNCISNVHAGGLSAPAAAETLVYLLGRARELGTSGVSLKDDRGDDRHTLP